MNPFRNTHAQPHPVRIPSPLQRPFPRAVTPPSGSLYRPPQHHPLHLSLSSTLIVLTTVTFLLAFPASACADTVALIIGAPSGLTNRPGPHITVAGTDVVAYRFRLNEGEYSEELPVDMPIRFSAAVTMGKQTFEVGDPSLQDFLDGRTDFIPSLTFTNVNVPTPVVFLGNPIRLRLEADNELYIEGRNIDALSVSMHSAPSLPAAVVNESLLHGDGSITYHLTTTTPETDFITIKNNSSVTASFIMNLNHSLFPGDIDVVNAIRATPDEYPNEPIQRKVWRFIRDNRYHWYPPSADLWESSSPALFFNSIGFGYCGHTAALYCQILTALGYPTRFWALEGHAVPEVLVDGRWELYDPDLQVYYMNHWGEVAGVEELALQPGLITNPISPLYDTVYWAYSQTVADIYASASDNSVTQWYLDDTINDYSLNLEIPPQGILEFPAVFAAPIHTIDYTEAPSYTNLRLTIPRAWTGTLRTPLVIHSIGYEGPQALSVIGRDSTGHWQTTPTVADWIADSWAPITSQFTPFGTNSLAFSANETAAIRYTRDGSRPTAQSTIYTGPIDVSSTPVFKYFAVDSAGNYEDFKCYYPASVGPYEGVTDVTLTMNRASPQMQGKVISFTAAASGSCGSYLYRFVVKNPALPRWTSAQAYSRNPVWTWNTEGIETGTYEIQVWARNAGSVAAYEAYRSVDYTIYASANDVMLATDKISPQPRGAVISWTAAAAGGSGTYEYRYCYWDPKTKTWSVAQPYSSNPSWKWNTAGIDTGTYEIQVWARNSGSTAAYEAYRSVDYTIYASSLPPASGVLLAADKASPQSRGAVITLTAAATGGSGTYEYRYCYWNPKTKTWSVAQLYSSNRSWTWNTAGIDTGTYEIQVWARNSGSRADYEAYRSVNYTIVAPSGPPASGVTLATDKTSPQPRGAVITLTAAAAGGSGTYEYLYCYWNPKTKTWSIAQPYRSNPSWTWNTAGIDTGTYEIQVWARNSGSTAAYEAYRSITYSINLP